MKIFKIIIWVTAALFLLPAVSYARDNAENLADVEKLFMEAKYDRVIIEADRLISAGAHGREELNYLKGLSLMQLNRFTESRQALEYMVERYPRGKRAFDGYTGIGDSYFLEGKYNEAITAYNNALNNFPDHKNSAVVYYKIGNSYQKLGISNKANEYFGRVKSASPLSFESRMITKETLISPKKALEPEPDGDDYYYVQAGYFKTKANAERLNKKLRLKGYESYIATLLKANTAFYRVKVGRFKTKDEAEGLAGKLKKDGYVTKVCR